MRIYKDPIEIMTPNKNKEGRPPMSAKIPADRSNLQSKPLTPHNENVTRRRFRIPRQNFSSMKEKTNFKRGTSPGVELNETKKISKETSSNFESQEPHLDKENSDPFTNQIQSNQEHKIQSHRTPKQVSSPAPILTKSPTQNAKLSNNKFQGSTLKLKTSQRSRSELTKLPVRMSPANNDSVTFTISPRMKSPDSSVMSHSKQKKHFDFDDNLSESPIVRASSEKRKNVSFCDSTQGTPIVNRNLLKSLHTPKDTISHKSLLEDLKDIPDFFSPQSNASLVSSNQSGKWDISPTKPLPKELSTPSIKIESDPVPTSVPVLTLGSFQSSLWLDFGDESDNLVGTPRSLNVSVESPPLSDGGPEKYKVQTVKIPTKSGFSLSHENIPGNLEEKTKGTLPPPFVIHSGESKILTITWTPVEPGRVREVIQFKLARGRLSITVHGAARGLGNTKKDKKENKVSRFFAFQVI